VLFLDNGDLAWGSGDSTGRFGSPNDFALAGDWVGEGQTRIGVFRNGAWFLDSGDLNWDQSDSAFNFGEAGDIAVLGRW